MGEHLVVRLTLGGTVVVVVADAAHQRGMFGTEHGVALVLRVGAEEVIAHEVALRHCVCVGQQRVEEGQRGVGTGVDEGVNPTKPLQGGGCASLQKCQQGEQEGI